MRPFAYDNPTDPAAAVATVAGRGDATFLAGGTNLVDHLRLGLARPGLLVDVRDVTSAEVTELDGGLRIGAAVPNSDLAADPRVRQRYPVLSQALVAGASGQLRNMATAGGNPLQRTRCAYFQDVTTPCNKRSPGSGCSAIGGATREMAILGASEHCVATHPSDMAVALAILDAQVQVLGPDGARTVPFAQLHRLPGDRPDRDTVLEHGELITAIDLPAAPVAVAVDLPQGARPPLVRVRAGLGRGRRRGGRRAAGGRADRVRRDRAPAVAGRHRGGRTAGMAVADPAAFATAVREAARVELADARPLDGVDGGNAFKVPLAEQTLLAALQTLTEEATP